MTGANAGNEDECWTCGEKGHKKYKCPMAGTKKTGAVKDGDQDSNSNHLRTSECGMIPT